MFDVFMPNFLLHGLEYFNRYYGVYMSEVISNKDPEGLGRIQIFCADVKHQRPGLQTWVYPAFDGAGANRGGFWPPEVGDSVWVSFAQGDASKPQTYWGGWFGKSDVPSEFSYDSDEPLKRGMITRGGHSIVFSDTPGDESVEISWHKPGENLDNRAETPSRDGQTASLKFVEDSIVLQVKDQKTRIIIEDGKITIDAEQVEIATGANTPAVRGNEWLQWAQTHTHGTAWGPSSVPLSPPPQSILSSKVKLV